MKKRCTADNSSKNGSGKEPSPKLQYSRFGIFRLPALVICSLQTQLRQKRVQVVSPAISYCFPICGLTHFAHKRKRLATTNKKRWSLLASKRLLTGNSPYTGIVIL